MKSEDFSFCRKFSNYRIITFLVFISGSLIVYQAHSTNKPPIIHRFHTSQHTSAVLGTGNKKLILVPTVTIACPVRDIITTPPQGRLGNLIWEYASTVVIGHFLNLSPYLPNDILIELGKVFRDLTVPAYEDTILSDHCRRLYGGDVEKCLTAESEFKNDNLSPWNILCFNIKRGDWLNDSIVMNPIAELTHLHERGVFGDVVILPFFISHVEAVSKFGLERFQKLFQFRPEILDLVRKTIHGVLESDGRIKDDGEEVSFVGIHVRRTDYTPHLKDLFGGSVNVADVGYYQRAMARMIELGAKKTVLFLVVSDDRKWCSNNLVHERRGVFWGGMEESPYHDGTEEVDQDTTRNHDLALMASRNDSIISYGTFGVTGALLAGGHTIAFNLNLAGSRVRTIENPPPSNYFDSWELMK